MNEEYQERIDNYLLGRLSDAEKRCFEQDLENNAELKDQYEYTKAVKDVLTMDNIEHTISNWNQVYNEEKKQDKSKLVSLRRGLYWASGIAAVFVIGFFMGNMFHVPNGDGSEAPILPYPSVEESFRGAESVVDEAVEMIDKKDYDFALSLLEERERVLYEKMNEEGSDTVNQKEYREEQENLKLQMNRVLWLKSQAHLGKAVSLLDCIRYSDSDYQEDADSLYNMLDNILKDLP